LYIRSKRSRSVIGERSGLSQEAFFMSAMKVLAQLTPVLAHISARRLP
jgi:hypothetical protein